MSVDLEFPDSPSGPRTAQPGRPVGPPLSFWTTERRLFALFLIFALAFSSFVLLRDTIFDELQINGPVYTEIQERSRLLADIAKPRLIVNEPYFLTHEMFDLAVQKNWAEVGTLSLRQASAIARHQAARRQWDEFASVRGLAAEMKDVGASADALLDYISRASGAAAAGQLDGPAIDQLRTEGSRLYAAHLAASARLENAVSQSIDRAELSATRSANGWEMVLSGVWASLVCLGLLVGTMTTRVWIVRPVKRAVAHFEALGSGDYTRPVRTRRTDEFGEMLRSLDRMRLNLADLVAARDAWLSRLRVLSRAVESSDAAIMITDRRGTITYVNPAFCRITGYSMAEAIGKDPRLLRSDHHDEAFYKDLWTTILSKKVWRGDMVNRRKDGTLLREQASISAVTDDAGNVTHFVSVKIDVTEQRAVEEALHASEERFALAMAGTDDGLWDWNLATDAMYFSGRWKSMLGYSDDEVEPHLRALLRLLHPDDRERVANETRLYLEGASPVFRIEYRMRHKAGHWVNILARGAAARNAQGVPVRMVGTHLDLTERVLMESRLAEAERRQREILEQSVQGFYQATPDGRLLTVNAALASMLEYDGPLQLLDEWPGFWDRTYVDPDRRADYLREMQATGFVAAFECRLRTRSGRIIWVAENARAVLDGHGRFEYCEGFVQDITQRKEAEQLKNDFVSFVTHQLRTPLSGIRWMLDLARQNEMDEETASFVDDAYASAERLIGLVNDLLDIGRLENGRLLSSPEAVDLDALIDSILTDVAPLVASKQQQVALEGLGGARVFADPQLTRQALLNLVSNAVKYTADGGAITIRAERRGEAIALAVQDSGIGIPAAAQARLFEKFYRAENAQTIDTEGTGLGLYLVRLIAERSGGAVTCTSVEGQGSTFTLTLPAAAPREHAA